MQIEDTTRIKRVNKLRIKEISGVDAGGAPGAEILIMRKKEEPSVWDRFVAKFKRADEYEMPMTTKEILDAQAQYMRQREIEEAFEASMHRILYETTGAKKVALLKKSVAEFAEAAGDMAEMQRRAYEIGAILDAVETSDLLPDAEEEIKRALKPQTPNKENQEVEMNIQEFLAGLDDGQKEELKRSLMPEAPSVEEKPAEEEKPEEVEVQRSEAPKEEPKAPEVDPLMEKLAAAVEALTRRVEDLSDSKETDSLLAVARNYSGIGKTHEEILDILRAAKKGGEASYNAVVASFDIAQKNADAAEQFGWFQEAGASGAAFSQDPDSVNAKVQREAEKMVQEGKAKDITLARAAIFKDNPVVREACAKEDKARMAKHLQ